MWLSIWVAQWLSDHTIHFNDLNQLLQDFALKFEAGEMVAVGHYLDDAFEKVSVKLTVEKSANFRFANNPIIEIPNSFQTDLHDFGFLVFNAKNQCLENSVETSLVESKEAVGAVGDDIVDQLEKAFSKVWVLYIVTLNHVEGWLAKVL
jgi:hypothetical protein